MEDLKPPPKSSNGENTRPDLENLDNGETSSTHHDFVTFSDDFDSACSTPYVSAPSSPGRGPSGGFFYSAPASPTHFILSKSSTSTPASPSISSSFEFEFSGGKYAANGSSSAGSMSSADELFHNGKIRPMKLSSHLQRPQILAPLIDLDEIDGEEIVDDNDDSVMRGRDLKFRGDRSKSLRRRTRSMSPLRTSDFQWLEYIDDEKKSSEINIVKNCSEAKQSDAVEGENETTASGASSRSSSVGRNSKRWVFLKEFLYRSKSEGRSSTSNGNKFWSSLSFTPAKDKKTPTDSTKTTPRITAESAKKSVNGIGRKGRVTRSAHELHYAANRAQSEEMRRKTFLPYRQGVLGCLGFSSKSYGAMNGFARALNPVSSR